MEILTSLVQIRKEKKIEQQTMAHYLEITPTTLSRYETGRREMPLHNAIRYAQYLDYDLKLIKK